MPDYGLFVGRAEWAERARIKSHQLWFYDSNSNYPPYPGINNDVTITLTDPIFIAILLSRDFVDCYLEIWSSLYSVYVLIYVN